jgi:cell division septal protein FtsQ
MIFKRTVTKREKRNAARKKLFFLLFFVFLILINITLIYKAFLEKPKPISSPLARNQISSTQSVEKKLKEINVNYTSIDTEKDLNYLIKLKDNSEVILDSGKSMDEQLASLQLILSQIKIEGKALKRLDFRYEKPIITFVE